MGKRNTGFSVETKDLVYTRASGRCEICGERTSDLQFHHRRPRGMGGTRRDDTNQASACLLLCLMHHNQVESYRSKSYDNGWLVHAQHDPLATPVLLRGVWHLLDNAGYSYRIPEPAGGVAS